MDAKPKINLFWVITDDHDEDWFIFARSPRQLADSVSQKLAI
jgi:hypothetical protein